MNDLSITLKLQGNARLDLRQCRTDPFLLVEGKFYGFIEILILLASEAVCCGL